MHGYEHVDVRRAVHVHRRILIAEGIVAAEPERFWPDTMIYLFDVGDALVNEVAVLHSKLTGAEQRAKSLRADLTRSQYQLDSALASVRSLTDEVKGLTAIIYAHRALPSPVSWLRHVVRPLVTFRA